MRYRAPESVLKKRSAGRRIFAHKQLWLLLLPALIYVVLFCYWPMAGVQIAWKDFSARKGIWASEWVGMKHFARFFNYPYFWQIIRNTLTLSLYALVAGFPLPIITALFLNEVRRDGHKKSVQMIIYLPHFISTVALCGMIMLFLDRDTGVINLLMSALGRDKVAFMTEPKYFKTIYVLSAMWQHNGWACIIYIAALSNVDMNLLEAARVDGANRWQTLYHINFQCILPVAVVQLILKAGQMLSVGFEKVLLLQNDLNLDSSDVISTYVYRTGLIGAQFSYTTAIGLFNNVANLLLLLAVNYLARRYSD